MNPEYKPFYSRILPKLLVMTSLSKLFDSQVPHHLKCRYRTLPRQIDISNVKHPEHSEYMNETLERLEKADKFVPLDL